MSKSLRQRPTIFFFAAVLAWDAHATPSGLNNIPTADTAPQGVLVLQMFSTVGGDNDSDFNLGFKTGVDFKPLRFEVGADSHVYPGVGGPVVLQSKVPTRSAIISRQSPEAWPMWHSASISVSA